MRTGRVIWMLVILAIFSSFDESIALNSVGGNHSATNKSVAQNISLFPASQNTSRNISASGRENVTGLLDIIKANIFLFVLISAVCGILLVIFGPGIGVRIGKQALTRIKRAIAAHQSNFKVTSKTYSETADLNQAIRVEFGSDYSLADWKDIIAASGGDIQSWANSIGLKNGYDYFVSSNGQEWNGQDLVTRRKRHFLITRFDHKPSHGYYVHDHMDNYFITLGSWYDIQRHAIAIKRSQKICRHHEP